MAIIDWDPLRFYFPLARTISIQDSIPSISGFDFTTVRGGYFGISLIYAFVYSLNGNILTEDFRFFPLLFLLVIASLLYIIARDSHSKNLGKLSILVFFSLPFIDEVLASYSYYPDILFLMLSLSSFWLMCKFSSTKNYFFAITSGLIAGSLMLVKPFGLFVTALFIGLIFQIVMYKLLPQKGIIYRTLRITPLSVLVIILLKIFAGFGNNLFLSIIGIILIIWLLNSIDSYLSNFIVSVDRTKLIIGFSCALLCTLPFLILTFGRNFFLFGSPLFLSWNFDASTQWATQLTQSSSLVYSQMSLPISLGWSTVIFTTAALGTAYLFPKVLAVYKLIKKSGSLFFIFPLGYFVLWFILHGTSDIAGTTSRWLYPLIPFVSILIAYGLLISTKSFKHSMFFCFFFFVFSLMQSRLLGLYPVSPYIELNNLLGNIGFSSQFLTNIRASPAMEQIFYSVYYGIIASLPLIFYYPFRSYRLRFHLKKKVNFKKYLKNAGFIIAVLISFSITLLPVFMLTCEYGDGNPLAFAKNSRSSIDYGGLYSEILPYLNQNLNPNETIIAHGVVHAGIQYYLPFNRIIDLSSSENLAPFYPLVGKNFSDSLSFLKEQNVVYFLFSKSTTSQNQLDNISKQIHFLKYISDPTVFEVLKETGSYKLLRLLDVGKTLTIGNTNSSNYWSSVWGATGSIYANLTALDIYRSYLMFSAISETNYIALQYDFPNNCNFTDKSLMFFFKCDTSNLNYRIRIYDSESNFTDYYFKYDVANKWQNINLNFSVNTISGNFPINIENVDKVIIIITGEPKYYRNVWVGDILLVSP